MVKSTMVYNSDMNMILTGEKHTDTYKLCAAFVTKSTSLNDVKLMLTEHTHNVLT